MGLFFTDQYFRWKLGADGRTVYNQDEIFVGVTPISKELDYNPQSVYNVLPLVLARSKETKQSYEQIFRKLQPQIDSVLKRGINYEGVRHAIELVWGSDLHTFYMISHNYSLNPASDPHCKFCPYCTSTWMERHQLDCGPSTEPWRNMISPEMNDP